MSTLTVREQRPAVVTAARSWDVWTTQARVVVTDPAALDEAVGIVQEHLAEVDAAASRFRPDSEVCRIADSGRRRHRPSELLLELITKALEVARLTGGAVDPTLGRELVRLGYPAGERLGGPVYRAVSWRDVHVDGSLLTVPPGTLLDLGASAKAAAADTAALRVAAALGVGVLVSLGGDLSVAGEPSPEHGWVIDVHDGPEEPHSLVTLAGARAMATSSTLHRTWSVGEQRLHHVLDPVTRLPARAVWRTVTVAADTCLTANAFSTAAIVWGERAPQALRRTGRPARLVAADGTVSALNGWPL